MVTGTIKEMQSLREKGVAGPAVCGKKPRAPSGVLCLKKKARYNEIIGIIGMVNLFSCYKS